MSGITEKNTAEFCTLRYFDLTPSDLSPSMAFAKQHRKPAAPAQQRFRPQQSSRYPNKYLSIPPARQNGFTLIEIAIVMVIITLILSGVLKGQELIDSARVRSLATEVTGIRTAWYSFQDRYRGIPGDFPNSRTQIDNATAPGNGNGKIDDSRERAGVWQQLALAGFINGDYDGSEGSAGGAGDVDCAANTCPRNPYNGYYKISFGAQAAEVSGPANEIFTGDRIPVNILAQLDSKLDDGKATSGRFRVHKAYSGDCTTDGDWDVTTGHVNCAGVLRE